MEACVPLVFFQGLNLAQGNQVGFDLALDEGGEVSGYRMVQLDYAGAASSPENPSTWMKVQWAGKIEQSVPMVQAQDLYAGLVSDGTKGATYAGLRAMGGTVLDGQGKALPGVKVATWPKSLEVLTDLQGHFEMKKCKVYDQTVFYACKDGYTSTLAPLPPKGRPLTLALFPEPPELTSSRRQVSPFFFGLTLPAISPGLFASTIKAIQDDVTGLNPGMIRLEAPPSVLTPEENNALLDQFIVFAKQLGAESMVTVPMDPQDPEKAAQWVRYCNVEKKYRIRYWAVGNEPDSGNSLEPGKYNVYDYINGLPGAL